MPMSKMRLRIAQRLKEAQNTNAMLTTFNEIDMSALMQMRADFKDEFEKKHGAKFGFMSAFISASAIALQSVPAVNAGLFDIFVVTVHYHRSLSLLLLIGLCVLHV